jgi:hypothetical protein
MSLTPFFCTREGRIFWLQDCKAMCGNAVKKEKLHALDYLCYFTGALVVGDGYILHAVWVHSSPADRRRRCFID